MLINLLVKTRLLPDSDSSDDDFSTSSKPAASFYNSQGGVQISKYGLTAFVDDHTSHCLIGYFMFMIFRGTRSNVR